MQVDVFSSSAPLSGNPVAVVLDSVGLSTEAMQKFASWTNLSETTFICSPTDLRADYKLRIFSPFRELPFAGHPTLGSCRAWLEAGGKPKKEGEVIQECGIGLVTIKSGPPSSRLSFAAPNYIREGDVSPADLKILCDAMGISTDDVLASRWIDNGPGWAGLILQSVEDVLAVKKDLLIQARGFNWGIIGAYEKGRDQLLRGLKGDMTSQAHTPQDDNSPHFELRAFAAKASVIEDPVTGSLKWVATRCMRNNG